MSEKPEIPPADDDYLAELEALLAGPILCDSPADLVFKDGQFHIAPMPGDEKKES